MNSNYLRLSFFTASLTGLLLSADPVLATQTHGQPEGLYIHQIAHVFFIIAMGSLDFWLRQRNLIKEKGWKYIQFSAILFILWNINAATVHFLDEYLHVLGITNLGLWHIQIDNLQGENSIAILYYLLKLDHLLCVPAMFFLYYGLKTILNNTIGDVGDRVNP